MGTRTRPRQDPAGPAAGLMTAWGLGLPPPSQAGKVRSAFSERPSPEGTATRKMRRKPTFRRQRFFAGLAHLVAQQPIDTLLGEAPLPSPYRRTADSGLARHRQHRQAVARQENDPCPLNVFCGRLRSPAIAAGHTPRICSKYGTPWVTSYQISPRNSRTAHATSWVIAYWPVATARLPFASRDRPRPSRQE
jgi:hypothetical protein